MKIVFLIVSKEKQLNKAYPNDSSINLFDKFGLLRPSSSGYMQVNNESGLNTELRISKNL